MLIESEVLTILLVDLIMLYKNYHW